MMNEEKQVAATTSGAVGISVFASSIGLCCIGPWAVALFGVSGAVTMARWAPYRPYSIDQRDFRETSGFRFPHHIAYWNGNGDSLAEETFDDIIVEVAPFELEQEPVTY